MESRQSPADVLAGLQCFHDFPNLSTQLNALQTVLVLLPQVAALQNSDFDKVKGLLQSTCKFCVDIRHDLERMARSEPTAIYDESRNWRNTCCEFYGQPLLHGRR